MAVREKDLFCWNFMESLVVFGVSPCCSVWVCEENLVEPPRFTMRWLVVEDLVEAREPVLDDMVFGLESLPSEGFAVAEPILNDENIFAVFVQGF